MLEAAGSRRSIARGLLAVSGLWRRRIGSLLLIRRGALVVGVLRLTIDWLLGLAVLRLLRGIGLIILALRRVLAVIVPRAAHDCENDRN